MFLFLLCAPERDDLGPPVRARRGVVHVHPHREHRAEEGERRVVRRRERVHRVRRDRREHEGRR